MEAIGRADDELENLFECQLCGAPCSEKVTCNGCRAFFYCGAKHQVSCCCKRSNAESCTAVGSGA